MDGNMQGNVGNVAPGTFGPVPNTQSQNPLFTPAGNTGTFSPASANATVAAFSNQAEMAWFEAQTLLQQAEAAQQPQEVWEQALTPQGVWGWVKKVVKKAKRGWDKVPDEVKTAIIEKAGKVLTQSATPAATDLALQAQSALLRACWAERQAEMAAEQAEQQAWGAQQAQQQGQPVTAQPTQPQMFGVQPQMFGVQPQMFVRPNDPSQSSGSSSGLTAPWQHRGCTPMNPWERQRA